MTVQDILDLVRFKFANVALAENNDAIIKIIYLGVSELYRKFNLSIKVLIESSEIEYFIKSTLIDSFKLSGWI